MIRAGLRELLDHAIACPVAEIGPAGYVDGRLILEEHEARAFAREIRARMQR